MAQALEGPISIVSRYISSSPRRPRNKVTSSSSLTKPQNSTRASKVLAALESLDCGTQSDGTESEIEILGPFPSKGTLDRNYHTTKNSKRVAGKLGATTSTNPRVKSTHPFFMQTKLLVDSPKDAHTDWLAEQMVQRIGSSRAFHQPQVEEVTSQKSTNVERPKKSSSTSSLLKEKDKMPLYSYKDYTNPKPVLVYTKHEDETNDLVDGLKPGPIAFDLEWRVFFTKRSASSVGGSAERRAAVVQLADTSGLILVIQVYNMARFPRKLQALIENPKVPKMGANILNDGAKLFRDYGILGKGFVELGALSLSVDPTGAPEKRKIISLAKLTECYCQKTLDKGTVRTGNWEAELGNIQLEYAGNDVHCTMMIYQQLVEIAKERSVDFDIYDPEFSSQVLVSHKSTETSLPSTQASESSNTPVSPQYLRAYRFWHEQNMNIEKMCLVLSTKGRVAEGVVGEPLKIGTVISYVIGALQANSQLPFEMMKLRDLVQSDVQSWARHRAWILKVWAEGRGVSN